MKKLPIGKQDFASLITDGYLYVDKTEIIHKLINTGSVYFLSRPRRFGKSLTVSTLKEIFSGNKELFKGLWIYDKYDWKKYSVIHFDFSEMSVKEIGLEQALLSELQLIATQNKITLSGNSPGFMFRELIQSLSKSGTVVILMDEYDKPIIDYIEDIPQADKNREILKNFYSVLKGNDAHIKFLFITGVSKFSKVSIFSDLNHLNDITIDTNFSTLCGYTENELQHYFKEYFESIKIPQINMEQSVKSWYNGYSWDGENFVYNPFSILNFFSKRKFNDYWFQTGTPTFLTKLIKSRNFNVIKLEGISVKGNVFEKYTLENMELVSLLFQTGYLTIKGYDYNSMNYYLAYPNNEVRLAFDTMLLNELTNKISDDCASILNDVKEALQKNEIEKFIIYLKVLFKNITYPLIEDKENYYHTIFYLLIKLLGFDIETEILTCDGRIDAVIKTGSYIYIVEFQLGTADSAMKQIYEKQYSLKYQTENGKVILLGIGFDAETKNISEYLMEEVS